MNVEYGQKLKFGKAIDFQTEIRRRVEEFFHTSGRPQRDCPRMYLKSAIILITFFSSYTLLVFFSKTWWQAVPLAILLGFSAAEIGFNIQHDGGHQAYSNHPWINKMMAMTLDLIGGSSFVWYWKHGVIHHTYANVTGYDTDIEIGILGRLSPFQKHYKFHRWQHIYIWPFYGILAIKWLFYDDFHEVFVGRIGKHRIPRPKGWELVLFIAGKVHFFLLAFWVPMQFHSPAKVFLFYGIAAVILGLTLSMVFQVVHVVESASFPMPKPGTNRVEKAWAVIQAETAVDYARNNRLVLWLVGGLNFQIEHHLFPRICHANYPAITKLVEATCREYGVRYSENKSYHAGLASHFRWLRQLGIGQETL